MRSRSARPLPPPRNSPDLSLSEGPPLTDRYSYVTTMQQEQQQRMAGVHHC